MALVKCKECGNEVSTKAKRCPRCGAKVPKGIGVFGILMMVLVVWVFFVIGRNASSTSEKPTPPANKPSTSAASTDTKPSPQPPVVENSAWDGSVAQVKDYLKRNLRDPDSYQSISWTKAVLSPVTGEYTVVHKYRAKNGYGGYEVNQQLFTLDARGKVIHVVPYDM